MNHSSDNLFNPKTIENNMKFTLQTYINFYAPTDTTDSTSTTASPDSSTIEQMYEGASQHPFYEGEAVYLLQSLLHKDIEAKLPQQKIRIQPVEHKQVIKDSFSGKIYPNPTSGVVNYDCTINKDDKVLFTLSNTFGSEIMKVRLFNSSNLVNIQYVKPGIYFYFVTVNGKTEDKGKIIINH